MAVPRLPSARLNRSLPIFLVLHLSLGSVLDPRQLANPSVPWADFGVAPGTWLRHQGFLEQPAAGRKGGGKWPPAEVAPRSPASHSRTATLNRKVPAHRTP